MGNADQLNEVLDRIAKGKTRDARRHLFAMALKVEKTLDTYLRIAFDPEYKITGLPEGTPTAPNGRTIVDRDIPAGMGFTLLCQELRRIMMFGPKGVMQTQTQERREYQWAREIEGLHWQEVDLLTWIKDGVLLEHYPCLIDVLDIVNIKLPDPAEQP